MTEYKLGKLPASPRPTDLKLSAYLKRKVVLPELPSVYGHEALIGDWGLYANDRVGDCVFAGAGHETILWRQEAGSPITFTDDNILAAYSAVTGYDPSKTQPDGSNPTDQGTDVHNALDYRVSTGLTDTAGNPHKIGAYLSIDPKSFEQVKEAIYLFSAVGIGIEFPSTAFDQFNAGKPWDVVEGASIEGGHYVPLVGFDGTNLLCVTWGKVQPITPAFFNKYCDEAYAILSPDMLNSSGQSLEGFNLAQLQEDLQSL